MVQHRSILLGLSLLLIPGCASKLTSNVLPVGQQVTAITLTGGRNLEGHQARVTDPDEVRHILRLIRKTKRSWMRALVNCDIAKAQFLTISIERGDTTDIVTMRSGLILDDSDDHGTFYDPGNEAQAELWQLALEHLGVEED